VAGTVENAKVDNRSVDTFFGLCFVYKEKRPHARVRFDDMGVSRAVWYLD